MRSFLEDIEFASKVNETIKKVEQKERDNCMELTKEMIKQQYGDVKLLQERINKAIEYINIFKNDIRGLDEIVLLKILQGKDENK